MSDILKYYQEYHKTKPYNLAWFKNSSRPLMIQGWLERFAKPGAKVLDIGCGDGSYSEWMPRYSWTGIDINEEKQQYNGTRIVGNVETFPYALEAGSQDAVVCSEVLEHLWHPEGVHEEANRVLKKGGYYIISTPNFNWIEHILKGWTQVLYKPDTESHTKEHIRFYDVETHIRMLDKAGFTVVDFCGADTQFGEFFQQARQELKNVLPSKSDGEVDLIVGKMFKTVAHTIGLVAFKR